MILSQGKIRPGRVLQVVNENGIIKATVPGLFSDQDDPKLLPPIYPFFHGNANSFSKVNEDDMVWVMFFENNPLELFWFRKDVIQQNISDLLDKNFTTIEVVVSKETDNGIAQLYFTDGSGWMMKFGDTFIQIDKDGNVIIDTGKKNRAISIDDNSIALGTVGGAAEPGVLGDKLTECLNNLYKTLDIMQQVGSAIPYTAAVAAAMKSPMEKFAKSIDKITSNHVTLD